jgi:hypothetical protein
VMRHLSNVLPNIIDGCRVIFLNERQLPIVLVNKMTTLQATSQTKDNQGCAASCANAKPAGVGAPGERLYWIVLRSGLGSSRYTESGTCGGVCARVAGRRGHAMSSIAGLGLACEGKSFPGLECKLLCARIGGLRARSFCSRGRTFGRICARR